MSPGTKVALACVIAGVLLSALAKEATGIAWALAAGFWIWQHDKQRQHNQRLRAINWKHVGMLVNHQCPPSGMTVIPGSGSTPFDHQPYSQGGIRPHLCVCGIPLIEHR